MAQEYILVEAGRKEEVASRLATERHQLYSREKTGGPVQTRLVHPMKGIVIPVQIGSIHKHVPAARRDCCDSAFMH